MCKVLVRVYKYIHTHTYWFPCSGMSCCLQTLGTLLEYLSGHTLFLRENLDLWLQAEAEELLRIVVCQGCVGRGLEPWALSHRPLHSLCSPMLFLIFAAQFQSLGTCQHHLHVQWRLLNVIHETHFCRSVVLICVPCSTTLILGHLFWWFEDGVCYYCFTQTDIWGTLWRAHALRLVQGNHFKGEGPSYHSCMSKGMLSLGQKDLFTALIDVHQ